MKFLMLIPAVLLTGCLSTPVKMKFPEIPDELKKACPELQKVDDNEQRLSVVLDAVVSNYSQYQECKVKVDIWMDWYKSQQQIWNDVK